MTNDDTRSPQEIEREIERERSGLSQTLDDLQNRFSVEHVARQLSDQFREHGGDIGRSISDAVKRNPMALALTGVGLAWLMMSDRTNNPEHGRYSTPRGRSGIEIDDDDLGEVGAPGVTATSVRGSSHGGAGSRGEYSATGSQVRPSQGYITRRRDLPAWAQREDKGTSMRRSESEFASNAGQGGSLSDTARDTGAAVAGQARDVAGAVAGAGHSMADSARSAAGSAGDMARQMRDRLSEGTESFSEEARERVVAARQRAVEASESAMDYARRGGERAADLFEDQPLVAGAIALAVGAALGAALPRTRMEDEYLGEQSDYLMDEAERIFEEEKQKLSKAAETAKAEARAMAEDLKDRAEGVAKTAVDQATESGSKVAGAAKSATDHGSPGQGRTST